MMKRFNSDKEVVTSGAMADRHLKKWRPITIYKMFLYIGACVCALTLIPNSLWDSELGRVTLVLGMLGVWRYCWWFTHAVRAEIYARRVFPKIRANADKHWQDGWRPRHIHFMMTTFLERRDTTERVVQSICREVRASGTSGSLWLGSGDIYDEQIICNYLKLYGSDIDLQLKIIRQNVSGKRMAIGLVLRAMCREGIDKDDIIVFMDGDAIFDPGVLEKCLPMFAADPELQALTTDEEVICFGPKWMQSWLTMRFAQRRIAMQSHSLSNKVLTLTGRMSVFRAQHLTRHEFIRMLEADHLEHWLWGKFRFLSGDDKSTWYYMLCQSAKMCYVPDALVHTVEEVSGSGIERMTQNFRRWSGNMLRNGSRALHLGPRKVGLFIWWCILDQRIAMWTMLVSPIAALNVTLLIDPAYLLAYMLWIAVSRMALSLFLYRYCKEVDFWFPWILYCNQLLNAAVKVYCIFRLSKQRWTNRGDQAAGFSTNLADKLKDLMAGYVTTIWVAGLVIGVAVYTEVLKTPGMTTITGLIF